MRGDGRSRAESSPAAGARCVTLIRSVTVLSALLFASVLLLASASGAAVVARLLRGDAEDDTGAEVAFAFSLPVGLVAAALPGWLFSGLRPLPIPTVALPLAALALAALLVWGWQDLAGVLARGRALVPPVVLFFAIFAFFLWVRAPIGEIRQTEKPMDFAVLSGLMATPRLPFMDPWLSGAAVPYYYFGTYLFALPSRAARVPSEYAYNLVAALLPALAALAAYGAIRAPAAGGGSALLRARSSSSAARSTACARRSATSRSRTSTGGPRRAGSRTRSRSGRSSRSASATCTRRRDVPVPRRFWASRAASVGGGDLFDAVLLAAVLSANPWDLPASLLILGAGNLAERDFKPALVRSLSRRSFPRRSFSCRSCALRAPRSAGFRGGRKGRARLTPFFTSVFSP